MHLPPAPSPHKYHHIPTQTSFTDTLPYPDRHQTHLSTNQKLPHGINPQDRSVTRVPDDFPDTHTFPGAHTGTATPLSINLDYRLMFTRSPDVPLFTSCTYLSSSATSPSPAWYILNTPLNIGPVPVPLYLLPIRNSLYSLFLYLCFSQLCLSSLRSPIRSNTCFNFTSKQPDSPTPTALLWDLSLGNVEATSYVELLAASPLPPPMLEDVHLQPVKIMYTV
ncbi:MAG: hypothetical protein NXY57DRAFT_963672 [Lentinula lateritia]|nr:MAG: hypothetical protein NXY57DRAFT_963672 [Lentinula lateritia]